MTDFVIRVYMLKVSLPVHNMISSRCGLFRVISKVFLLLGLFSSVQVSADDIQLQLDDNCVVSILNRSIRADSGGGFAMPNIPDNMGKVRARATCQRDGITVSGETDYFTITTNGLSDVGDFFIRESDPTPQRLTVVSGSNQTFTSLGATRQLEVSAVYSDGTTKVVTEGVNYQSSTPDVVTVSDTGVMTSVNTGRSLVTIRKDGVTVVVSVNVVTSGDTDGDGIADDIEVALGLDPNDPIDGLEDLDKDGLSNVDEVAVGTDIQDVDTDDDGANDGEEVLPGEDGYISNPLVVDTDGDGISDGLELLAGTNPDDASDNDVQDIIASYLVTPTSVEYAVNTVDGEQYIQLDVVGQLIDGATINLTKSATFNSSNLLTCNFGGVEEYGRVFLGESGMCNVTITYGRHVSVVPFVVTRFSPVVEGVVGIGFTAHNVDVDRQAKYAYVADSGGLSVVDLSALSVVSRLPISASYDVKLVGSTLYLAAGEEGLVLIDVTNPILPLEISRKNTPGLAQDLAVADSSVYVADGDAGVHLIDVSTPLVPVLKRSFPTSSPALGVALDISGGYVGVAEGVSGVEIFDLNSELLAATVSGGDVRDLLFKNGNFLLADYARSFVAIDVSDVSNPRLGNATSRETGGLLNDVASYNNFVLGADVYFVNGVPIISVEDPMNPAPRAILDFSQYSDDNGTGVAVNQSHVYMTAKNSLYVGKYRNCEDPDADSLCDFEELRAGTNPNVFDTDEDGLGDGYELQHGSNPLDGSDADSIDTDGDGLGDGTELSLGLNPERFDTDGDGLGDGEEIRDYITDPKLSDTDGDGLRDGYEVANGLNPLDRSDGLSLDTDGDGLTNYNEINIHGTNPDEPDTDFDGLPDGDEINNYGTGPHSIDSDFDGYLDNDEIVMGLNPVNAADGVTGAIYNKIVSISKPLAYWRFNESGASTIAYDSSGSGFDITYPSSISLGNSSFSRDNYAVSLSQDEARVLVGGDHEKLALKNAASIEYWVYYDGQAGIQQVLSKGDSNFSWAIRGEGGMGFSIIYEKSGRVDTNCAPQRNRWTYCVYTFDGRYHRVYRDGVLRFESDLVSDAIVTTSESLNFGAPQSSPSETPHYAIDEIAIYGSALSEIEIRNRYYYARNDWGDINARSVLQVSAAGVNEDSLTALGLRVASPKAGIYWVSGGLATLPELFTTNSETDAPSTLLEPLRMLFINPTDVKAIDHKLYLSYVVGRDAHAGGGPNGVISYTERMNVGLYVAYGPFEWPNPGRCCFYHPNWVQDVTNNIKLFDDSEEGVLCDGCTSVTKALFSNYFANTQEVRFYMNYGWARLIAVSKGGSAVSSVTGGEWRDSRDFVIPKLP